MADFNVRSDSVNVEQIMEQIRSRIREKRGVDYTEEQIRELAAVKLQKFLDPRGVRSDLLEQFRKTQPPYAPPELPNYAFEDNTLFESHRAPLRFIRAILRPILKLFFNPNPLIQALNIQSRVNTVLAEREARLEASRRSTESLYYELIHNLVVETTRLGIEVKNLTMRVESMSGRLEFNERRARALESAVVYKPSPGDIVVSGPSQSHADRQAPRQQPHPSQRASQQQQQQQQQQPQQTAQSQQDAGAGAQENVPGEGPGQRSRRRRRRRGRRGGASAAAVMGAAPGSEVPQGESGPQESRPEEPSDGAHSASAESFEQAMGAESHPTEASSESQSAGSSTAHEPPPATPPAEPDTQ